MLKRVLQKQKQQKPLQVFKPKSAPDINQQFGGALGGGEGLRPNASRRWDDVEAGRQEGRLQHAQPT